MFRKQRPAYPVDASMKVWIEERLAWLCQRFGIERMLNRDTVVPTDEPYCRFDGSEAAAKEVFNAICGRLAIPQGEVGLEYSIAEPRAVPNGIYEPNPPACVLYAEDVSQFDAIGLVAAIANVLAYHLLVPHEDLPEKEREQATELLNIYSGFGVFVANAALADIGNRQRQAAVRKRSFLATQEFGYALAVYANLRGEQSPAWQQYLRPDVNEALTQGCIYLEETEDCLFHALYNRGSRVRNEVELVSDLASPWEGTRVATLREIGRNEAASIRVIEATIVCLADENRDVRASAAAAIAKVGASAKAAMSALMNCMEDREPRVRARAVRALGQIPFDGTMLSYFEMGLQDDNNNVVYETVGAIGNQSPATALLLEKLRPVMKHAIVDGQDRVAKQVISAMLKMTSNTEVVLRQFFDDDEELERLALDFYAEVRSESAKANDTI